MGMYRRSYYVFFAVTSRDDGVRFERSHRAIRDVLKRCHARADVPPSIYLQ